MKHVFLAVLCFISLPLFATTRYVAQTAGTFVGGTACNGQTAITPTTWNGITNAADDVIWLCGTITGSAGATIFTPLGNGSSGHPITINWDTGADVQVPYCNITNGCFNLSGLSWYVLDGKGTGNPATLASGGDPSTHGANGIIECTANGTALANQQDSLMIRIVNTSHLTVQNLWFKNNYVRIANTVGGSGGNADVMGPPNGVSANATDLLVTHNYFTNAREAVGDNFTANGQNYEASFNYTFAVELPFNVSTVTPNVTWTGVLTHDNHLAGGVDQWDEPSDAFHHDGCCHMFAQATNAHINGWKNYNNLTDGVWGNDLTYFNGTNGTHITTYMYAEQTGGDLTDFNNVYDTSAGTPKLTQTDNGTVDCKASGSTGMSCAVYNDTFIGQAGNSTYNVDIQTDATIGVLTAKNNIHINQGGPYYMSGASSTSITSTNNVFFGMGGSNWNQSSFATWQAAGQDPSPSVNAVDPKVNTSTYKLGSGSSAIGMGANLTALGITALNSDAAGVARPGGSTAWDAGAFQFQSSPVSPAYNMKGGMQMNGGMKAN